MGGAIYIHGPTLYVVGQGQFACAIVLIRLHHHKKYESHRSMISMLTFNSTLSCMGVLFLLDLI